MRCFSVDQARSFASFMHNEDNILQYFAIDFNEEIIGLHASEILSKAAFVNDALEEILTLYESKNAANKGKMTKITLLGHSYGGYIAKTSPLLSNYPEGCPVSNIVMLGTPNVR